MPHARTMYAVVAECNDIADYHALFQFEEDAEEEAERLNGQDNANYRVIAVWCCDRLGEHDTEAN